MTFTFFQIILLSIFAFIEVNECLDTKAATPSATMKLGLNITSVNFISPFMEKVKKYSSTIKNFVQKKMDEMRIIYAGLVGSTGSGGGGLARPPGAPVMQVTRPLAAVSRRPLDLLPLLPPNKTA